MILRAMFCLRSMHSAIVLLRLLLCSSTFLRDSRSASAFQGHAHNVDTTENSTDFRKMSAKSSHEDESSWEIMEAKLMDTDYTGAFKQGSYQYIPEHDTAICGCAKCGCTSLWTFVYQQEFGKEWQYKDPPWVMATESPRWQGKVTLISANQLANVKHKYALIRDPRERIISAWKSKVTCDSSEHGTDTRDRKVFVPELRRLAGLGYKECMDLEEYLRTLDAIHQQGKASQLNAHFLPQQFYCFRDFAPHEWTMASPISNIDFARALGGSLGNANATMPKLHASFQAKHLTISDTANAMLKRVTESEYKVLQF